MSSATAVKPEPVDSAVPSPSAVAGPSTATSSASTPGAAAARSSRPASRFASKVRVKAAESPAPANYSDYRLVSSGLATGFDAPEGTPRFNVVKFQSTAAEVDPRTFARPIAMNRRDPRPRPPPPPPILGADDQPVAEEEKRIELRPVLDGQGRIVKGPDGEPLMAPKQSYDASLVGGGAAATPAPIRKKNPFKKKTKQVYKVDADVIRLRREERHPWVLESADGKERWVGRMEDTAEKQSYVGFVFEDDKDAFEVVDVRRWFKFQKRATYETLGVDEAEELYARVGKGKDPRRWFMHDPTRTTPSGPATTAAGATALSRSNSAGGPGLASGSGGSRAGSGVIKREEAVPGWLRRSVKIEALENGGGLALPSRGGGSGWVRVKQEGGAGPMDVDDDEEVRRGGGRRGSDGGGADGENDQDFDDEFSDDDGLVEFDQTDEQENKELEEKLKREFRQGNAQGEDAVSDDEDLFGEADQLGDAGKAIKKALRRNRRRRGGDDDDDSDGNSNPYASSEEESSEEDEPVPDPAASSQPQTDANGQATILLPDGTRIAAPPVRPIASRQPTQQQQQQPSSSTVSRHPSPGPPSVGAQILAQRATSPHRPNRSRSASRDRGRTASPGPTASGAHSREASPAPGASGSGANKRKSTPEASGASAAAGGADDNKRARVDGQQPGQQQQQPAQRKLSGPSERVIVEYIRKFSPDIPQLIKHFKRSLKSPIAEQTAANKAALIETTKKVATLNGVQIVLKPEYSV